MSTARDLLIKEYATHYSRLNRNPESNALSERAFSSMQLMFGNLIASLPRGSKVLDLGCGAGFLLAWLAKQPGIIPIGVDRSISQLAVARQRFPEVEFVCDDGLAFLRQHVDEFAAIFCTDVLEHLPGLDRTLEWVIAARDALQSDGFFLCRVPNAANLTASYSRYMDLTHERCFTSASLSQLLDSAGLQNCRIVHQRAAHLSGRIRLASEAFIHLAVFRLCGRGDERVFTYNISAVGYKALAVSAAISRGAG